MKMRRENWARARSGWNYVSIVLVIALGFTVGGYLSFGVRFMNALSRIKDPTARLVLVQFGIGMLGACWWATSSWALTDTEVWV